MFRLFLPLQLWYTLEDLRTLGRLALSSSQVNRHSRDNVSFAGDGKCIVISFMHNILIIY